MISSEDDGSLRSFFGLVLVALELEELLVLLDELVFSESSHRRLDSSGSVLGDSELELVLELLVVVVVLVLVLSSTLAFCFLLVKNRLAKMKIGTPAATPIRILTQGTMFMESRLDAHDDFDVFCARTRRSWDPIMSVYENDWSFLGSRFQWQGASIWPIMTDPKDPTKSYIGLVRSSRSKKLKTIGGRCHTVLDKCPSSPLADCRGVDACATAAREFFEETIGTVKLFDIEKKSYFGYVWKDWAQELRDFNFVYNVIETVPSWSIEHDHIVRLYAIFIVKVPWDPSCVQRFQMVRSSMMNRSLPPKHPIAKLRYPEYFRETAELAWEPWFQPAL